MAAMYGLPDCSEVSTYLPTEGDSPGTTYAAMQNATIKTGSAHRARASVPAKFVSLIAIQPREVTCEWFLCFVKRRDHVSDMCMCYILAKCYRQLSSSTASVLADTRVMLEAVRKFSLMAG